MSKVRNLAEIAPNIGFSEFDFYDLYRSTFEKSELGRIKSLLPLRAMAKNFGLVSKRLGIHRPRTKFIDVQKANLTYRKQRKHSKSQTRKMTRRLLELLGKMRPVAASLKLKTLNDNPYLYITSFQLCSMRA